MTTASLCILAHARPDEVHALLRSVTGDSWDEIVVLDSGSNPPIPPAPGVVWHRADTNLGVTKGRNVLAARASGEILAFVDDDAVVRGAIADRLREGFGERPALGAVAFKIVRSDGSIERSEFPFRGPVKAAEQPRPCAYFVGAGYAVRRAALDQADGYNERYFYSTEEVDLSFRLAAAGWELAYDPRIVVEHRPSSRGRSRPDVPAFRMRNRLLMVRQHLPWPVAVLHAAAWVPRTLPHAIAARNLRGWLRAVRDGVRWPVHRRPLGRSELLRLHRLGGRVLW